MSLPRYFAPVCGAVALLALGGCSSTVNRAMTEGVTSIVQPYRIDIVQGNVVTQEQLAHVSTGMTREQVLAALGTPLLRDPLHANRWDYAFAIRRAGTETQARVVTVWFDATGVSKIDAPELPTEQQFVASIARPLPTTLWRSDTAPVLTLTPEQVAALPVPPPAPPASATAPQGAARAYPPLGS